MSNANAPLSATPKIEDYVPTTEEVIRSYLIPTYLTDPRHQGEPFRDYIQRIGGVELHNNRMLSERAAWRWLAQVKAAVWDEAMDSLDDQWYRVPNPYRMEES